MSEKFYSSEMNEEAKADFEQNRIYAMLAYLVFFLPLIACPASSFGRYHANQGLMVLLFSVLLSAVKFIPFVGKILFFGGGICLLILIMMGVGNAAQGKMEPLPVIGRFTLIRS